MQHCTVLPAAFSAVQYSERHVTEGELHPIGIEGFVMFYYLIEEIVIAALFPFCIFWNYFLHYLQYTHCALLHFTQLQRGFPLAGHNKSEIAEINKSRCSVQCCAVHPNTSITACSLCIIYKQGNLQRSTTSDIETASQYRIVQYYTLQYSTVQYSTVQYSTV